VPGGDHLPRNLSDEPFELVLIELKEGGASSADEGGPDATVVDAGHYSIEFENDRVRVLRAAYGPGEESALHHHPANVAVFLTDIQAEMTMEDGSVQELSASAGDAVFAPAELHTPRNASDAPLEVVLVELK
jgi:quercetin dioxygenase-like cupin family protein